MLSRGRATLVALLALGACSSVPAPEPLPPPSRQPPASAPAAVSVLATPLAASAMGSASAATTTPPPRSTAAPAPTAQACPDDMKLVLGDYCTEVEHKCLVEWWAPQNKKRVCEEFEHGVARCVGSRRPMRFCIDTFEWPNAKGARPEVMNTFYQAQVKCAAAGKRMCTESEWNFACEGPQMKPFPHGWTRDPRKCNGDHEWDHPSMKKVAARDANELARLWRGVPSGSQPACVSDFGVHDMPANADEVVAGESPKAKYSSVNTGGPWYSGVRNQCRPKVYTHGEDFYYYFLSFRCCAAADGAPNDPRTHKQIEHGWALSRVERLAGFAVAEMRETLERKRHDRCSCAAHDVLCKTMCGTLLGPGAKDGDDSTRSLHKSRHQLAP